MLLGLAMVLKSFWFLRNLGRMNWAERFLSGYGESVMGYKLVGLVLFFIGFFLLTGWIDYLLVSIFSPRPNAA